MTPPTIPPIVRPVRCSIELELFSADSGDLVDDAVGAESEFVLCDGDEVGMNVLEVRLQDAFEGYARIPVEDIDSGVVIVSDVAVDELDSGTAVLL